MQGYAVKWEGSRHATGNFEKGRKLDGLGTPEVREHPHFGAAGIRGKILQECLKARKALEHATHRPHPALDRSVGQDKLDTRLTETRGDNASMNPLQHSRQRFLPA